MERSGLSTTHGLGFGRASCQVAMSEITDYETSYPNRILVACPCDWLEEEDVPHTISSTHVLARGTCERAGASLDDVRMRLVMNDPATGKFARQYRVDNYVKISPSGSETLHYRVRAQCPYDGCDGEFSLSWIEGSSLRKPDDRRLCKTCGGAIAGVDWRVGTDCISRGYPH